MLKRLAWLILLLGALGIPALGQSYTAVSATITDSNSIAYINCTYNVTLANATGQQPLFGGAPLSQTSYVGSGCNSSGALSITLPSNAVITPSGTQWTFNVCARDGVTCFSSTNTVSGSTDNLTTALSNASVAQPCNIYQSAPGKYALTGNCTPSSGGVTSIQMKNAGTNYGSPLTGVGSLNFVNCTVSGTSPAFTITCAAASPGGSNTQVQRNNNGAFGGITGATSDGTNLAVTTQSANDNSTKAASTAYVDRATNTSGASNYPACSAISGGVPSSGICTVTISAAQLKAMNQSTGAVPLLPAQGANTIIRYTAMMAEFVCNSCVPYVSPDGFEFYYCTNGDCSDTVVTTSQGFGGTGFLDQTTSQYQEVPSPLLYGFTLQATPLTVAQMANQYFSLGTGTTSLSALGTGTLFLTIEYSIVQTL